MPWLEPTAAEQEEFWNLTSELNKVKFEVLPRAGIPRGAVICWGEDEGRYDTQELERLGEELTWFSYPGTYEDAIKEGFLPPGSLAPGQEYPTNEERLLINEQAIAIARYTLAVRKMAAFDARHAGKSFKVFRPEWIERAFEG